MNYSLPRIASYGEYQGNGNYGAHCLSVRFSNGFEIYYSYKTIVAFRGRDGLKVHKNDWRTTTGKHLNWIDGGDKKARLASAEFDALLTAELEHYGLTENTKKECEHVFNLGESEVECAKCGITGLIHE